MIKTYLQCVEMDFPLQTHEGIQVGFMAQPKVQKQQFIIFLSQEDKRLMR